MPLFGTPWNFPRKVSWATARPQEGHSWRELEEMQPCPHWSPSRADRKAPSLHKQDADPARELQVGPTLALDTGLPVSSRVLSPGCTLGPLVLRLHPGQLHQNLWVGPGWASVSFKLSRCLQTMLRATH